VKLLLDQNLSHRLVQRLQDLFPGSAQVRPLGLSRHSDAELWWYARTHGYVLVTKDEDFAEMAVMRGAPPKVVWLRVGNCSTSETEHLLVETAESIRKLVDDDERIVLELFA
jgi:predicted nuclease of predicted toxin-antitoxin system